MSSQYTGPANRPIQRMVYAPVPAEVDSDPACELIDFPGIGIIPDPRSRNFGDWPHVPLTTSERN